jgi:hypothetical protein
MGNKMANEGDEAAKVEELLLKVDLINALNKKVDSPTATGECLFCYEPLTDKRRWCDEFCRDDWQREQDAKSRAKSGGAGWTED